MDVVSSHNSGTGPIMHHELPTADALETTLLVERDSASTLRDGYVEEANNTITSSTQDNH